MLLLQGYKGLKTVGENEKYKTCRGYSTTDGHNVLIKTPASSISPARDAHKLILEYEISKSLDLEGIVKPYRLEKHSDSLALIMEDFGGIPLRDYFDSRPYSLQKFFAVSTQLCKIIGELHERNVVHRNINPDNIFVDPKDLRVKISGFGIGVASAYMSPEQTGRMNRTVDQRTDLYSLGVTFFEMLSGRLPFEAEEPIEWVHAHIARKPADLRTLDSAIPGMICEIIGKLLAKPVEERYQSAYGLQADLQNCSRQWSETGRIDDFPLGAWDVPQSFDIPQTFDALKEYASTTNITESDDELDLFTMLKAGQAFSEEMDLEQLLIKLMRIIIENAGAQKGCLIVDIDGGLILEAAVEIDGAADPIVESVPLVKYNRLSSSIVSHVAHTLDTIRLDDAVMECTDRHDKYIRRNHPKSILCLPITVKGRPNGILYLENNLVTHAFALKSPNVLKLLGSQAFYVKDLIHSFEKIPFPIIRKSDKRRPKLMESLTARELEVLNLMAKGFSNQEIAQELGIVVNTIKVHIKNIYGKLEVNKRMKAVAQAKELQLLKDPP